MLEEFGVHPVQPHPIEEIVDIQGIDAGAFREEFFRLCGELHVARGHGLLSDEVGAVDTRNNQLLPFRRTLSIRPGPLPEAVQARLQARELYRHRSRWMNPGGSHR